MESMREKLKPEVTLCMVKPFCSFLKAYEVNVKTLEVMGFEKEDAVKLVDECVEEMYRVVREEK